jgi:hypothetical protein
MVILRIYLPESHLDCRKILDKQLSPLPVLDALEQKLYAGLYPICGPAMEDNIRRTAG